MTRVDPTLEIQSCLDAVRADVESYLSSVLPSGEPESFYRACRYVLESGGKRVRPLLTVLACESTRGGSRSDVLPAAAAVEVFHNFTLVHDDIMDRSDVRRGRPTVHVEFGENIAILAGDYLLGLAYAQLDYTPARTGLLVRSAFNRMVVRLCEGQALDMILAERDQAGVAEYLDMIDRKTGALISCCLEIGTLIGGGDSATVERMRSAGRDLGRAFQIQDDLLDATAAGEDWGKRRGQDLMEGKRTYLVVSALDRGTDAARAFFRDALQRGGIDESEVATAVELLEKSDVLEAAADEVAMYVDRALAAIGTLPETTARAALESIVGSLAGRTH